MTQTPDNGSSEIAKIATLSNGQILAFGSSLTQVFPYQPLFTLARYNSDGSLDLTFDFDGIRRVFVGYVSSAGDLLISPGGKYVTVGTASTLGPSPPFGFVLAIVNPDGTLFKSSNTAFPGYSFAGASAVVALQDGKLVSSGAVRSLNGVTSTIGLMRYNEDGTIDSGFGTGGQVIAPIVLPYLRVIAAQLQSDGKIVLGGSDQNSVGDSEFALFRFNPDGSLDNSFGSGGVVLFNPNPDPGVVVDKGISELAIQNDGKIVAAGKYDGRFALLRFNPDGGPDGYFGTGGMVTADFPGMSSSGTGIVIQQNGQLTVSGEAADSSRNYFALARYNSDGSLDAAFGSNGLVTTPVGISGSAQSVTIQEDQKIVLGGRARLNLEGPNVNFAIVRYLGDSVDGTTSTTVMTTTTTTFTTTTSTSTTTTTLPNQAPSADSLTPVNIATVPGAVQSFTAVYSDPDGYIDISTATLTFWGQSFGLQVVYHPSGNEFTMAGADGTCAPGQAAVLTDGYLTLNCSSSSVSSSGTILTITYNLTPQPPSSGAPYQSTISVMDQMGASHSKTTGSWIVNRRPSADSVSPMDSMTEPMMSQTFTAVYSDPDGWENIAAANFYLSGNGGLHNEWLHYLSAPDLFTMMGTNDVCSPGQATTLSNGFLTLDCSASSVSGSGNVLTVIFQATPLAPSSGINYNIFTAASDHAGASHAIFAGTWQIQ